MRISIKPLAAAAAFAAMAAGCTPMTDIVATNTEATGDYSVPSTTVSANAIAAEVCVADPHRAPEVADRIVRQLVNHGYQKITLDIGSEAGPVSRFVWSPDGSRREPGGPPAAACTRQDRTS